MRISIVSVAAILLFLCLILEGAAGMHSSRASQPLTAPLHVVVPTAPWAFQANGKWHLVYELHLANIGSADCTLTRIAVLRPESGARPLASLTAADLDGIVIHFGAEVEPPSRIPPAGFAVAYMWVTVEHRKDVPAMFFHRITMKIGDYPEELQINTPRVVVNRDPVPVISSPLRGSDWGAGSGPANDSFHRRGLLTVDGHAYIAERFAIDWLRFTRAGDLFTGDGKDNKSYPGYGSEVLAVADGVITEELDHIPENTPGVVNAVAVTLETLCGNHLVQRIGKGLYASYCHLQPGSLRVHRGTTVKRGQAIGLVGNSGNSSAPHLHFQLCDANSVLACEGVPYAFRAFAEDRENPGPSHSTKTQPNVVHTMEIPTMEMIVNFIK